MATRQFKDIKFRYTRDDEQEQLVPQRQYIDNVTGDLLTPVTPLFLAREVPSNTKVERPKEYDRRYVESYINNPSVSTGVSKIELSIPYAPGDINHTAQLREILALPRVICVDYYGEVRRSFT